MTKRRKPATGDINTDLRRILERIETRSRKRYEALRRTEATE